MFIGVLMKFSSKLTELLDQLDYAHLNLIGVGRNGGSNDSIAILGPMRSKDLHYCSCVITSSSSDVVHGLDGWSLVCLGLVGFVVEIGHLFSSDPTKSTFNFKINRNESTTSRLGVHKLKNVPSNLVDNSPLFVIERRVSSRVVVDRHRIRIRPWPHPNTNEVMRAHQIIGRVQREQRIQFGVKTPKTIIAITPTYVRTFQMLHLTGVMHSLLLVLYDLIWIVVEAGGITNETMSIITKSALKTIHIGFKERMSNSWEGGHKLEAKMRLAALRVVREKKLDGLVLFADENIEIPLSLLKDPSMVEPLESCERQVMLWWLRVEARSDSKFPPGYVFHPSPLLLF
ncbi:probable beta-1,4-xylosyltransferase IRX14H [Euphorbia lathyris]|uniref:probable beta-1,4-xylosyltransferase IRX14H n=1 Tax=Euphorbia lathyris TaxID=212925 RepID=UPI0033141FDC